MWQCGRVGVDEHVDDDALAACAPHGQGHDQSDASPVQRVAQLPHAHDLQSQVHLSDTRRGLQQVPVGAHRLLALVQCARPDRHGLHSRRPERLLEREDRRDDQGENKNKKKKKKKLHKYVV